MIIAIDGPAAAGKGTLARRLADHLGFDFLDTGSLYRAVGLQVLRAGGSPEDPAQAEEAARHLDLALLADPALRSDATAKAASQVAAQPAVRAALLDFQRDFAHRPPGKQGAVLDGRDVGTVVCPDAGAKLFVTASLEARAKRRLAELQQRGQDAIWSAVLQDMRDRDARDERRDVAPLKPAADAVVIDTTALSPDQVFKAALAIVTAKL
ncbi:MAG: (d)CMP kinase [Rhodospirillaceae bacterium]|nr:(d)CMP kinase [Rhodospirillaceae bacterium]